MSGNAGIQRFLSALNAYAFLFDFVLCYAIYTALFELRGLSATEIGGLIAFWSATAVLLEVPSGALSDRFDRRLLLFFAPLVKALTFVCWALADGSVLLYGLGFLCWSAGSALYSGTAEALLYERLEERDQALEFDRHFGRVSAAESLGIGAGLLLGGFVAQYDMDSTLWLSIPPMLLASVAAIWLADTRRRTVDGEPEVSYLANFGIAAREFLREPELRTITIYIAGGLIVFEVLEEFEQLYYLAVSLPIWLFGVVGAAALAGNALASTLAHRLGGRAWIAWAMPLVGGALFVLAGAGETPVYVLVLLLAYVAVAPVIVLSEARFQALQEGRSRATTTSMLVVAQNVMGIAITLGFGVLVDHIDIAPAYAIAGLTMLPVALWTFVQVRSGRSPIG